MWLAVKDPLLPPPAGGGGSAGEAGREGGGRVDMVPEHSEWDAVHLKLRSLALSSKHLPLVSLLSKLFELLCRLQSKLQVYLIMRHCVDHEHTARFYLRS